MRFQICLLSLALLAPLAPIRAQPPAAPSTANAARVESDVFDWKWQPPSGYRGRFKIWTRTKSARLIAAQPSRKRLAAREENTVVRTAEVDFETISRDERGAPVSRFIYRRVTTSTTRKRNGRDIPDPLARVAKARARVENAVLGVEIDIKHGPDGQVWSVQGIDRAQRNLRVAAAKASSISSGERVRVLRDLEQKHSQGSLRREWGGLVLAAPEPVRVGETWRISSPEAQVPRSPKDRIRTHETRTLLSLSAAHAVIGRSGGFTVDGVDLLDGPVGGVMEASFEGQSTIDRSTGVPLEEHFLLRTTLRTRAQNGVVGREIGWTLTESRRVFTPF